MRHINVQHSSGRRPFIIGQVTLCVFYPPSAKKMLSVATYDRRRPIRSREGTRSKATMTTAAAAYKHGSTTRNGMDRRTREIIGPS